MITRRELAEIGQFNKPHGINGEISVTADIDLAALSCIVVDIDGIFVPFFLSSIRPKRGDTVLVKIDGYDSEKQIRQFVNKALYALLRELPEEIGPDDADDEDGMYASDFIGYRALLPDGSELGEIADIDDNTENVLFIISSPLRDKPLLVPVADEFIASYDPDAGEIILDIPDGLLAL